MTRTIHTASHQAPIGRLRSVGERPATRDAAAAKPAGDSYQGAARPLAYGTRDRDYDKPDAGEGRRGAVRQLQHDLKARGFFPADVACSGGFFRTTTAAVKAFQTASGLPASGRVDAATQAALNGAAAPSAAKPAAKPAAAPTPTVRPAPAASTSDGAAIARLKTISHAELARLGATNKKAFFDLLRPAAEEAERRYGVPAAITLAQVAFESGWGKHVPGGDSFNIFGIKGRGPAGSVRESSFEKNRSVRQVSSFAKYHNFYEAVVAHGELFQKGYYKKAMAAVRAGDTSPQSFLRNIEGVYHQDGSSYTRMAMSIVNKHGLQQG